MQLNLHAVNYIKKCKYEIKSKEDILLIEEIKETARKAILKCGNSDAQKAQDLERLDKLVSNASAKITPNVIKSIEQREAYSGLVAKRQELFEQGQFLESGKMLLMQFEQTPELLDSKYNLDIGSDLGKILKMLDPHDTEHNNFVSNLEQEISDMVINLERLTTKLNYYDKQIAQRHLQTFKSTLFETFYSRM